MIPDSFIEQLKYANPVDEVIGSYVSLKRRGRNLTGLCPFHSEKTPSFTVYPENGSYYCFGCSSGGDVITFIRNIENIEYIEALKMLAGRAGMQLPEDSVDDRAARLKGRVLELNRAAARYFHSCLKGPEGGAARAYLLGRGLTAKTITGFGLGFAPDSWDTLRNHLRAQGFSEDEMLAAAVVNKGRQGGVYDSFRGRVIFPIIDLRGNVIAFGGRTMGERGPKYLNSADTPVFKKSRNLVALDFANSTTQDTFILAEGYMDVIAIHQAGFDNAVATLGTSLTAEQARLLAGYTKKVAIAYDSDAAGQAATKRAINLLGETDIAVSVLEIQGAKDPDEFIKKFGPERFAALIAGGRSAVRFEIDKIKARHDLDTAEGKSAFLGEFCRFLAGISGDVQRDVFLSETARELEVSPEPLRTTVRSLREKQRRAAAKRQAHNLRVYAQDKPENRTAVPQSHGVPRGRTPQDEALKAFIAEQRLIALLLKHPDVFETVQALITPADFQSPDHRALYEAVAGRLAQNLSAEPIHLSNRLDPRLMSLLTGLIAANSDISFLPEEATAFCDAILAQNDQKTPEEIGRMNNRELDEWHKRRNARKRQ